MQLENVEKIIELLRRYGVHQIEIEENGVRISVTATALPAPNGGFPAFAMPSMAPMVSPTAMAPVAASAQGASPPPAAPEGRPTSSLPHTAGKVLKSPFVGTFYRSATPGGEPFVSVGQRVKKGDTLCIVEAMKLMNEIEAECDGVVREILVDNEQPVEFDQALFVIE